MNTLQISEKIHLFSLGEKKESSNMSILVNGIAHQDGVELF